MPLIPTAEQRNIQHSRSRLIVVEANAGAAKTTTAALRIDALIQSGTDPRKIVVLCFSSPGVRALQSALKQIGVSADVAKLLRLGTIDDFCAVRLAGFESVDVPRHERPEKIRKYVLQAISAARSWAEEHFPGEFSLQGTGEWAVEGFLEDFSQIKGSLATQRAGDYFSFSPADSSDIGLSFTTLAVFRAYEQIRTAFNSADGEQVLFRYKGDATYDMARMLVSDDPPFTWDTHPLRVNIAAVILDEMNDCNWAMFTVIKSTLDLSSGASFLGIGDRDQVIHARDGADSYFMGRGFEIELGRAEFMPLTQTHRFGAAIASPLGKFADKAYRANPDRSAAVSIQATTTAEDIVNVIAEATTNRRGLETESTLQDIAVLLRHPGAAVELEHILIVRGVAYESIGFNTFLERPEVLFVRMILTAGVRIEEKFGNPILNLAKKSCFQFLEASLESHSAEATDKVVETATEENFFSFVLPALVDRCPIAGVSERVANAIDLASSDDVAVLPRFFELLDIHNFARRQWVRAEDIEEVEASIHGLLKIAREYQSIAALLKAFLQYDNRGRVNKFSANRIVLSTIADAKGLEFDHVIIPNVNAREFDGNLRDERNLFYVAASRARNLLTMTHQVGAPSSYLNSFLE